MSIRKLSTKSIITCLAAICLLVVISVVFLGFVLPKNVTVVDMGVTTDVSTLAKTVEEVLNEKKISLNDGDKIEPELSAKIEDGSTITILRAKNIVVKNEDKTYQIRSTATTAKELLEELEITLGKKDRLLCDEDEELTDGMTLEILRAKFVKVTVDGKTHEKYTTMPTVKEFLDNVCIHLKKYDEITPALETPITEDLEIKINRVTVENVTKEESIAFSVIQKQSSDYFKGQTVTKQNGVKGLAKNTYKVIKRNGKLVSKTLINSETIKKPVEKIVMVGTRENQPVASRGDLRYKKVIQCKATAYEPGVQSNGKWAGQTATGLPLGPGMVAVDPKVIPLGSRLYIESTDGGKSWSYGYAVAGDTGGAIKGNRVDLCYNTVAECYAFGVRQCNVYILE